MTKTSRLAEVSSEQISGASEAAIGNGKLSMMSSAGGATLHAVPTVPLTATQLSLAAVGSQLALGVSAPAASEKAQANALVRQQHQDAFIQNGSLSVDPNGTIFSIFAYNSAVTAIAAKAAALGYGAQSQSVAVTGVPFGYLGRYSGHDIYFSPGGKAFEIHGEIRAKYEALGGAAGALGLPLTDETGTPDGVGRYNHFEHGSIYWTPQTGPMMVRGTVRDRWAASGWERGPLGYPVQDQHRMRLRGPLPLVEWCLFQNGLVAGDIRGGQPVPMAFQSPAETLGRIPPPALLTYTQLGALFGSRFNKQFMASPDNVALRAGVTLTGVSDWRYNFWQSTPRSVGFRLHGFHDNGLAPDTNFVIDIRLRFQLVPQGGPSFTEPLGQTLVAVLDYLNVGHDGGLALAQVYASVDSAITKSFYSQDGNPPDPSHPEVPSGAIFVASVPTGANVVTGYIDILDVLITTAGDLQILVNPLTPPDQPLSPVSYAFIRQSAVQDILESLT